MRVNCTLELEFRDKNVAEIVLRSVKVDDYKFVRSIVKGKKIIARIESKNVLSMIRTIDDYLSCVSIAERVTSKD